MNAAPDRSVTKVAAEVERLAGDLAEARHVNSALQEAHTLVCAEMVALRRRLHDALSRLGAAESARDRAQHTCTGLAHRLGELELARNQQDDLDASMKRSEHVPLV